MISVQNKKCLFPLLIKGESWMWLWVCTMTRMHSIMLGNLQIRDEEHEHVFMYPRTKACDCMPIRILRRTRVDQAGWRQKHKFAHTQFLPLLCTQSTALEPECNNLAARREWCFSCRKYHPSCKSHFSCCSSIPCACWHLMPTWSHSIFQEQL